MKEKIWRGVARYSAIIIGSAMFALGFAMFLDPNHINCGGVSGLSMIILHLWDFTSIGVLSALLNLPLFLIGLKKVGWRFFFGSLVGMLVSSLLIDWFAVILPPMSIDKMLSAIFGGVLTGVGLGIVFAAEASTGGTDILGRLLKRISPNVPIGKMMLLIDIFVITLTGIVFQDIESTLYSAITLTVSSIMIDKVVYSMDFSKVAWVISDHYEEISTAVCDQLDRGVTMIDAKGYYLRQPKSVLLCAVKRSQIAALKELVHSIDPNAFVILQDAHQVIGDGFKRYDKNDL